MDTMDKVANLFDGHCPGNIVPNFKHECRQLSQSDFAYQWMTGEMIRWMNYWWEVYQLNKKYFWFIQ